LEMLETLLAWHVSGHRSLKALGAAS